MNDKVSPAQVEAIGNWGVQQKRVLRLSEDDQAANTRRERQQRREHTHGALFHHAAEHAVCAADHLPRLQSRRAPPVPGALRPPCLGLPVRLRRCSAFRFRIHAAIRRYDHEQSFRKTTKRQPSNQVWTCSTPALGVQDPCDGLAAGFNFLSCAGSVNCLTKEGCTHG